MIARRLVIALTVSLFLVSCAQEDASPRELMIAGCEWLIKRDLRAPSTYEAINVQAFTSTGMVIIQFDAQNLAGVPIRNQAMCEFQTAADQVALDEDGLPTITAATVGGEPWPSEVLDLAWILFLGEQRRQAQD